MASHTEYMAGRRDRARALVRAALSLGCSSCGATTPDVRLYHPLDKREPGSYLNLIAARGYAENTMAQQIAASQTLCAPCGVLKGKPAACPTCHRPFDGSTKQPEEAPPGPTSDIEEVFESKRMGRMENAPLARIISVHIDETELDAEVIGYTAVSRFMQIPPTLRNSKIIVFNMKTGEWVYEGPSANEKIVIRAERVAVM